MILFSKPRIRIAYCVLRKEKELEKKKIIKIFYKVIKNVL